MRHDGKKRKPRARTVALAGLGSALLGLLMLQLVLAQGQSEADDLWSVDQIPFFHLWAASPHANAASDSFTHWNDDGEIPVSCAACHSTPGFLDLLGADGTPPGTVDRPAAIGTVVTCVACHNDVTLSLAAVDIAGRTIGGLGPEARCMSCHQGRTSAETVEGAVAGLAEDTIDAGLVFINPHYAAAAAVLFGAAAGVAFEYEGKVYSDRPTHSAPLDTCTSCHDAHSTQVRVDDCAACHRSVTDMASLRTIRLRSPDYDGNGNEAEGVAGDIANLSSQLLETIQAYATEVAGIPIAFDGDAYPYFFIDSNGNGVADSNEAIFPNRYASWTPRLLKAAYNYLLFAKDPGAFAHNTIYTVQILYDSIEDLGVAVSVDLTNAIRP